MPSAAYTRNMLRAYMACWHTPSADRLTFVLMPALTGVAAPAGKSIRRIVRALIRSSAIPPSPAALTYIDQPFGKQTWQAPVAACTRIVVYKYRAALLRGLICDFDKPPSQSASISSASVDLCDLRSTRARVCGRTRIMVNPYVYDYLFNSGRPRLGGLRTSPHRPWVCQHTTMYKRAAFGAAFSYRNVFR